MQNFARSGAHLEAMKASPRLAQEIRTYTYPGEELPDWNQAKAVLFESGQVLDFSQKD